MLLNTLPPHPISRSPSSFLRPPQPGQPLTLYDVGAPRTRPLGQPNPRQLSSSGENALFNALMKLITKRNGNKLTTNPNGTNVSELTNAEAKVIGKCKQEILPQKNGIVDNVTDEDVINCLLEKFLGENTDDVVGRLEELRGIRDQFHKHSDKESERKVAKKIDKIVTDFLEESNKRTEQINNYLMIKSVDNKYKQQILLTGDEENILNECNPNGSKNKKEIIDCLVNNMQQDVTVGSYSEGPARKIMMIQLIAIQSYLESAEYNDPQSAAEYNETLSKIETMRNKMSEPSTSTTDKPSNLNEWMSAKPNTSNGALLAGGSLLFAAGFFSDIVLGSCVKRCCRRGPGGPSGSDGASGSGLPTGPSPAALAPDVVGRGSASPTGPSPAALAPDVVGRGSDAPGASGSVVTPVSL